MKIFISTSNGKAVVLLSVFLVFGQFFNSQAHSSNETDRVERGNRPPFDLQNMSENAYEEGVLLIKFKNEYTGHFEQNPALELANGSIRFNLAAVDNINDLFAAQSVKQIFLHDAFNNTFTDRHKAWGFHLWYKLTFDPASDIRSIVEQYQSLNEIEIAEPEFKKELIKGNGTKVIDDPGKLLLNPTPSWIPDDPQLLQQWHYNNTGQTGGTPGADISLFQAWNIEKGNSDVIVAIIDDGIQFTHPDLAGNMWPGIGYNFASGSSTILPGNHGTHVAGTVAAISNNGVGVAGIAGGSGDNDGVRLMSCQVFSSSGNGGFHLAPVWAADNGASISQNSWTYTSAGFYNQNVLDAIDYFNINGGGNALVDGGITIFAAANYNSSSNYYPAFYSGTYAVAGTNHQDMKAWYSNFGSWVDISAPGGETTSATSQGVLSTLTNNSYGFYQGTSMACPHVSGVAALVLSLVYGQLTPGDLADILSNSADDHYAANPGFVGQLGSGRLNAYAALIEAQGFLTGIINPSNFTANALGSSEIELSWNKNDDNDDVMLAWSVSNTFGIPDSGMIYQAGEVIPGGGNVLYKGGNTEFLHDGLEGSTTYYYRIWSLNENYTYSTGRSASSATTCATFQLPFTENFSSISLSCWSFPDGQGNWNFGNSYTPPSSVSGAPNAYFTWNPSATNYSYALTSPPFDGNGISEVKLNYILFINNYSGNTVENMAVEYKTLDAEDWILLENFSTAGLGSGNAEHVRHNEVLPGMAGDFFQIRFRAHGPNSFNINGWGLDDVTLHGEVIAIIPGDANCDGTLNVLDGITIVNYIMGSNPDPFCFENADVTNDGVINVLDIIGTVNIILGGTKTSALEINSATAQIFMGKNGILLESDGTLAGLQFEIIGMEPGQIELALEGFEFATAMIDGKLTALIFSFDNTPIPSGKKKILRFSTENSGMKWGSVVAGNLNAEQVNILKYTDIISDEAISAVEIKIFPNPSSGVFTLDTSEEVHYQLLDMTGRVVAAYQAGQGIHQIDLTTKGKGIYFLIVNSSSETSTHKLVIK